MNKFYASFNAFKKSALLIAFLILVFLVLIFPPIKLASYEPDLTTRIYDRNDKLIYEIYDQKNRIWVQLDQMPKYLVDATIAVEDKRFYNHPGIDPVSMVRAAKAIAFDDRLEGGSTITQQYIRNAHLSLNRTLDRKVKEILLSLYFERINTKDEILEKYLNEVSYGGVNWGVGTASKYYFGKEVKDLSLAESAFLAGLTSAPSRLSPRNNENLIFKQRQELVLNSMVEEGFISNQQKDDAFDEKLNFTFTPSTLRAAHFSMMVKDALIEKYGLEKVQKGGLVVKTSLDIDIQEMAEKVVLEEVNKLKNLRVGNGAVVVTSPQNGEMLAMVGSKDYFDTAIYGTFNVPLAYRQPGSSIKPVMYATAFEKGYTPATILSDIPTKFVSSWETYEPKNYDDKFHGNVSIRSALANSYNVPAVRMLATIGVDAMVEKSKILGIDDLKRENVGLSLTLGGGEVQMTDMAKAYGVLANSGIKHDIITITQINDASGKIVYQNRFNQGEKVVAPEVAYLISDILSDNQARSASFGTNSLLNIPGKKVAVKTGTSNDKRDNWTIGYTPDFVVTTWVGNNDNTPMHPSLTSGITGATPIWHRVMQNLVQNKSDKWYSKPDSVILSDVDAFTGQKPCGSGKVKKELFVVGTEPKNCGNTKITVVQMANGQENIVKELTREEYLAYLQNPQQATNANLPIDRIATGGPIIAIEKDNGYENDEENNKDKTDRVFIKISTLIEDPLTKLTGQKSVINIY
ncbi:MAG TPA: PBP1A family penicillin-binding protein [Patescibacteria group bacterium]